MFETDSEQRKEPPPADESLRAVYRRVAALAAEKQPSANDRFKAAYRTVASGAVVVSVAIHFAAFELFPNFEAADFDFASEQLAAVELPPEVRIPPPPEAIVRPARPRVSTEILDEDITIAATTFEENPAAELAPPPPNVGVDPSAQPVYVNRDTEPRLLNREELLRLLRELYPRGLKAAGVGGEVMLWVWVDEEGHPGKSQVQRSSGYERFDHAAMAIAERMRFSPAELLDKPIGVWIAIPVTFSVDQ
jgi:protein TonB